MDGAPTHTSANNANVSVMGATCINANGEARVEARQADARGAAVNFAGDVNIFSNGKADTTT